MQRKINTVLEPKRGRPYCGADKPGIMSFSRMRRGSFAKTLKSIEPEYSDLILDGGIGAAARNQWFFEIAWEVANKGDFSTSLCEVYFGIQHVHDVQNKFVSVNYQDNNIVLREVVV